MKKTLAFAVVALALLCSGVVASAQTTSFTYQGSLNNGGTPANGNHDFEFALFDAAGGGIQIGSTLTRSAVAVANGVFSVSLDFGSQFPGANRFLEVRVRQSGGGAFTPLAPRQPVSSSPYSINAAQLGGVPASSYLLSGASVINAATQFSLNGQRVLSAPGVNNLFLGFGSGANNVANSNTFVGFGAGQGNTVGGGNTFFGTSSGFDNTTGPDNAFFGSNSGRNNTTGGRNTFLGGQAGRTNTTGTDNTFAGFNAGFANLSGSFTTAFGSLAGQLNTASSNSFFGGEAGAANTNGTGNSFFGRLAGSDNSTGDNNTFIGRTAGNTNTIGNDNTILGSLADTGVNNLSNATAIGARALVTQSNSLILGSISGVNSATANTNVGIGTTAPINRLTIGEPETPVLHGAVGLFNAGGTYLTVRDTTNNIEGFVGADVNGVLIGSLTDTVVRIRTGNVTRMFVDASGNVGVTGILNGASFVTVGTLESGGFTPLCHGTVNRISTCGSSLRYKSNVNSFNSGLSLINRLRPVSFDWKSNGMHDVGLVAEEVAEVEPLLTTTNKDGSVEGVKYDRVGVVLVNAVKEQQAEIESQRQQIAELRSQVEAMKKLICSTNSEAEICK